MDQILLSGYFDRVPSHENGVCEVEEEPTAIAVVSAAEVESTEVEEQNVDPGPSSSPKSFCTNPDYKETA